MKKRNIIAVFSALACLALLPIAQAAPTPETPDPGAVGGTFNTADGHRAMPFVTGLANSAFGAFAGFSTTANNFNTAVGAAALDLNTADNNTAVGTLALFLNTTGAGNTAVGVAALEFNTAGLDSTEGPNVAVGYQALMENTTGSGNIAVGASTLGSALGANTTGTANTAVGQHTLRANTDGIWNTAVGAAALLSNVSGDFNTAIGVQAGLSVTGSGNVCIGQGVIGVAGENDTTRERNIGNTPLAAGAFLMVDSVGGTKLGYFSSSRRNKDDIKPMDNASEAIYCLKPVSFRYKPEIDPTRAQQYGLIAEDVEAVSPDLVVRDKEGKAATLRFEGVNAMLLNEFLKEHKKVEEQQVSIAELKSTVAQQQKGMEVLIAQLKEQAAQIQKVSAQLEVSKPATSIVLNRP